MELRELAAFREVARQSSFSRAASRLGYAQSTVSAQIQALEADLGVQLFDRLGRSIALTDAGQALLPHAERLVELAADARMAVAEAAAPDAELVGTITVSAPESLLTYRLPAVLSRFRAQQPGVTIDLRPTPIGRFRAEVRRAVASGAVDLAFVLDTPLNLAGFRSEVLLAEPVSVVAPASHRLASVDAAAPADLEGEPLLLPEAPDSGCAYRGQFERQLTDAHVNLDAALEFASIETVKQCVIAGMGVSVLPAVAVDADVAAGRLARLAWREPFELYTQLVWHARRSISPAQAAFMATARAALAEPDSAMPDAARSRAKRRRAAALGPPPHRVAPAGQ
jgi:DNA-binding transcriptional LysR family regulator